MRYPLSHILPGFCALITSHCFNIDMDSPGIFTGTGEAAFGQQVLQFRGESENWIIVTAPSQTGPGSLYRCSASNSSCQPIEPSGGLGNASLSTVAASATQLVACAANVAQPCASNIHVSGTCYLFDNQLRTLGQLNPGTEECPIVLVDVVFLFDGSNSLKKEDLEKNKSFMLNMIESSDKTMHFAIVQYSAFQRVELSFHSFIDPKTDLKSTINKIKLMESITFTARGIRFVTDKVFTEEAGARQGATKMLIVITDGARTNNDADLEETIKYTNEKKIIRCAIGVGDVFTSDRKAEKELETIASSPDYLIKVNSYDDLHNIFEGMKSKIYNIEGTQSSSNQSSFEQEMSQSGFSAMVTEDAIAVGSVGSFDWSGGVMELRGNSSTFINVSKSHSDMKNAYLGYSVTAARLGNRTLYVVGAPRYQHKGKVVVFERGDGGSDWEPRQHIHGEQIGSYFGSELCSLDLNGDGGTDLLLIGAPLYHAYRTGGIVIVCTLSAEGNYSCPSSLQGQEGNGLGRFGSAVAALGDLSGDGLADVAVGAPLEDGHRGSIYIYHGAQNGIAARYSQRIAGSAVSPGLRYFGQSIQGNMDVSQDGLNDLVVGALGKVVLLRSRPVVDVTAAIMQSPEEIALWRFVCPGIPEELSTPVSNLTVCFNVSLATSAKQEVNLQANLTYELKMDVKRLSSRVLIDNLERDITRHRAVTNDAYCFDHEVFLTACVEDYLSPIEIQLSFSLTPFPTEGTKDLPPILNQRCATTLSKSLPVEKNCGQDDVCVDNLNVTFNLGGTRSLLVGNSAVVEISVFLKNLGEDSYKPRLRLHHPIGLHFRKLANLQATQVDCSSGANSTANLTGIFSCNISHPIFRSDAMAMFVLTFEVSEVANWESAASIEAKGESENEQTNLDHSFHSETIPVLYAVKIIISRVSCTRYISFQGSAQNERTVNHIYKVENLGIRDVPVKVTFDLPQDVAGLVQWDVRRPQNPQVNSVECVLGQDSAASVRNASGEQSGNMIATSWTRVFCDIANLERNRSIEFRLLGVARSLGKKVGSDVKLEMRSQAHILLDEKRFVDIDSPTSHWAQAVTEVEFQKYYNQLPVVIGSSVSGFVLLIIVIIVLYKCGFFNRNYREKICDAGEEASSPITPADVKVTAPDSQNTMATSSLTKPTD